MSDITLAEQIEWMGLTKSALKGGSSSYARCHAVIQSLVELAGWRGEPGKVPAKEPPVPESDDVKWAEAQAGYWRFSDEVPKGLNAMRDSVCGIYGEFIRRFRAKDAELAHEKQLSRERWEDARDLRKELDKACKDGNMLVAELAKANAKIERLKQETAVPVTKGQIPLCFTGELSDNQTMCGSCGVRSSCIQVRNYWIGRLNESNPAPAPAPDAECERLAKWCEQNANPVWPHSKTLHEIAAILRSMTPVKRQEPVVEVDPNDLLRIKIKVGGGEWIAHVVLFQATGGLEYKVTLEQKENNDGKAA